MATPKEALTGTSHNININNNAKASPSNLQMGDNDTVTFNNNDLNDAATVTFLGAGAGEFSYQGQTVTTFTIPASGSFGPLSANVPDVTVNYNVVAGVKNDGPFAIEVGNGPLEIDIVDDQGNTNLGAAEIPNNGTLFFKNESTDDQASITFGGDSNVLFYPDGSPVVSPVAIAASSSTPHLTGKGTNKNVTYTIAMSVQEDGGLGGGNGSIKVGQT